jgi:predicted DNA-binding transcriptional regulator AlpA
MSIFDQDINMSMRKKGKPIQPRLQAFLDAEAAAKALGVSRNTLYAYVSRGFVRSTPHPSRAKASLYAAADVQALITRKVRMRRPRAAAASALEGGLPVLKTRITHFEDDRLFYRSKEATSFSREATLGGRRAALWDSGDGDRRARSIRERFGLDRNRDASCRRKLRIARQPCYRSSPRASRRAPASRVVRHLARPRGSFRLLSLQSPESVVRSAGPFTKKSLQLGENQKRAMRYGARLCFSPITS